MIDHFDNFHIEGGGGYVESLQMIGLMQTSPKVFQMRLLPKGQEMGII